MWRQKSKFNLNFRDRQSILQLQLCLFSFNNGHKFDEFVRDLKTFLCSVRCMYTQGAYTCCRIETWIGVACEWVNDWMRKWNVRWENFPFRLIVTFLVLFDAFLHCRIYHVRLNAIPFLLSHLKTSARNPSMMTFMLLFSLFSPCRAMPCACHSVYLCCS